MRLPAFILALFLSTPLWAADTTPGATPAPPAATAKELANMKSFDVQQLQAQATALSGEVVKVKFTYRVAETEILDDGGLKGTIGFVMTNVTTGVPREGTIVTIVPKEGRAWFMKVPTATNSRRPFYAIARVHILENVPQAELLGREVRSDFKGPQLIWDDAAH